MFSQRPRRNRKSSTIRSLVQETSLSAKDLVLPLFLADGKGLEEEIAHMPGCKRWSIDRSLELIKEAKSLGVEAFALFPAIEPGKKDSRATEALNPDGLIPRAIDSIKQVEPEVVLISDVALDPYSSDGHDGLVEEGRILNDESVEVLAEMALVQAAAGADIVAPSDMMDGRVAAIRETLDENSLEDVSILSYAAKYASSFYGPFRSALESAPKAGDKKTYQMDPANRVEALREVSLDIEEGADMVMVKPALSYLDVISDVKAISSVPVAAYSVSGEYSMIKAAASLGYLSEREAMYEMTLSIKRAGADIILSYFSLDIAKELS